MVAALRVVSPLDRRASLEGQYRCQRLVSRWCQREGRARLVEQVVPSVPVRERGQPAVGWSVPWLGEGSGRRGLPALLTLLAVDPA